ncbi:MAG: spore coat protein CotJB [Firmicutes bacterium]|nr:spore coat protein CotJB [Bacillota bacterium]
MDNRQHHNQHSNSAHQQHHNQQSLKQEIMEVDFGILELNLFLNTNPNDSNAIKRYNELVMQSTALKDKYHKMFGPIQQKQLSDPNCFKWIERPWPWERQV